MSIENVVRRFAVQTAVLWANPVNDGRGGYTYDIPIEIKVRWDETTKLIVNRNRQKEEMISTSQILTNQEIYEGSILFNGSLSDLLALGIDPESGDTYPHPANVQQAYRVLAKDKTPMVRKTDDFVRIYYLQPNWEQKI